MLIVFAVCGLVIIFAYEIRQRLTVEHFTQLDNETHRLNEKIKKLEEQVRDMKKKQEAEAQKGFKFPFLK